ncbi:MAG TPA: hypothetical protein VN376_06430 [Longilinea sp.]|nr:hypothetical protein [Longilinea sp.]
MDNISPTAVVILVIFIIFIIALNVSLITAWRRKGEKPTFTIPNNIPGSEIRSKEQNDIEELSQRVRELQRQSKKEE